MVPIVLDALHLTEDKNVVEAMADFSQMPYTDGATDTNSDVANVSEDLVPEAFEDLNLTLNAGIHLHWALPDALTQGSEDDSVSSYPWVPDRWLITRPAIGDYPQKQWIVESNYLSPVGEETDGVSVPIDPDPDNGIDQPYRFLGRSISYDAWPTLDAGAEFMEGVTAVGYGETAFAAFYPNCHSVFGFHDPDLDGDVPDGLVYQVLGWYSKADSEAYSSYDDLASFVTEFQQDYLSDNGTEASSDEVQAAIEDEYNWSFSLADGQDAPTVLYCYSQLTFSPAQDSSNPDQAATDTQVTMGNTGTEALSAYLAGQINEDYGSDYKSVMEDQLESIMLSAQLGGSIADTGPKFEEARHEKGFTATPSGSLWIVRKDSAGSAADASSLTMQATLPDSMAELLNEVNVWQSQYNQAQNDMDSQRTQLFADWYKYMMCSYPPQDSQDDYPDVDEVRHFLTVKGMADLQNKVDSTGTLYLFNDDDGNLTGASDNESTTVSDSATIAVALANALNALISSMDTQNVSETDNNTGVVYVMTEVPDARYWQPNEPVVLMTGSAVKPTERHGNDGVLECDVPTTLTNQSSLDDILTYISTIETSVDNGSATDNPAFKTWTNQPWNSFLLEWEVEVFPLENKSNLTTDSRDYDTDFITDNYTLEETASDFSIQSGKGESVTGANLYRGSSVLTDQAGSVLFDELESYLESGILQTYYTSAEIAPANQSDTYLSDNFATIMDWYQTKVLDTSSDETEANDITYTALQSYALLIDQESPYYGLSQALGGFNDALLMHKMTLQLAVSDPLGFSSYQTFAQEMADAIQNSIHRAPQPLNDFNPMRTGAMSLNALRLVDTFGQIQDLDLSSISCCDNLTPTETDKDVELPPRLVQPARLDLNWLSATDDTMEMNSHPATTPVCGWVLSNHLDNSLMVYNTAGAALGEIDQNGNWSEAIGSDAALDAVSEISNSHLQNMVSTIISLTSQDNTYLADFILTLDQSMTMIEPDNASQQQGLALLIGQPVALVRASLNLELQGETAIHQGWPDFREDLSRETRDTDGVEHIQFPIRVGEYQQLNDGLVGYWVESEPDVFANDTFYAPQTEGIDNTLIETHTDDPINVVQSLESNAVTLTMLMDPRGSIHATSGILPTVVRTIPPDQYSAALEALEVSFLTTPILTNSNQISLPLPNEAGYQWTWIQKEDDGNGNLSEVPTQQFPADGDPDDEVYIGAVNPKATFAGTQEIREGWLKLSPKTS